MNSPRPRIAITMGDVTGIGPEVVARVCVDGRVRDIADTIVIGHPIVLERALALIGSDVSVIEIGSVDVRVNERGSVPCFNPADDAVVDAPAGQIDPRAGAAAAGYLDAAIDAAKNGDIDAIVTAPLNKAALYAAGFKYPGHTEILADRCGCEQFAMMLYVSPESLTPIRTALTSKTNSTWGLSIAHVTLHASIASVPQSLSVNNILDKILLVHEFLESIGSGLRRIGVCALNPHAGEDGLFGDEESRIISPAVEAARQRGITVEGPFPTDTLVRRAVLGEFDGLVAMYHDQGHIPVKLIAFDSAVNVTLGLPIIRTSPTHGTAFDIAWQGRADHSGMIEAIRTATKLVQHRTSG